MLTAAEIESGRDGLRATQRRFLEALATCGSIVRAADIAGIHRDTPYGWLNSEGYTVQTLDGADPPDGSFARALLQAKSMAAERALGRIDDIVTETNGMPAMIGAMFTVKRWYPEYRDQLNVKHSGAVLSARVDLNQLDQRERAELLGLLQRRLAGAPQLDAGDPPPQD